jgi:hypothetical protein
VGFRLCRGYSGQVVPVTGSRKAKNLSRLALKIEFKVRLLGSVDDDLGQIQADSIKPLLSRPVSDLHPGARYCYEYPHACKEVRPRASA